MYKCQITGELIGPNVPMNKVVVERRERTYEKLVQHGPNKGEVELVYGWEIVKELVVGPNKYKEMTGQEPNRMRPSQVSTRAKTVREENSQEYVPWRRKNQNKNSNNKRPEVQHVEYNNRSRGPQ